MEAPRLTPAKKGKDCSIGWEGYGLGFLGCRWYSADRLSPKRTNNQWYILCFTSDATTGKKLEISALKLTESVLFHQDNAPVHKSVIAMAAIHDCGFKLNEHPPYSPDLAPSDLDLFLKLKTAISGTHFQSDDDVIHAVDDFLNGQEKDFFKRGIEAFKHHLEKCIDTEGDYVEKIMQQVRQNSYPSIRGSQHINQPSYSNQNFIPFPNNEF